MNIMLISLIIYFCVLASIGLYFYFKTKTEKAFLVGDRSINYFVTAVATQASDMGAWLFLAFPAAIYANGMPEFWTAIGLVVFMFLNWHFIAPKLRTQTAKLDSLTLPSFFADCYPKHATIIRLLTATIALVFFTFYISSGLVGLGRLFESAFSLDYHTGVVLGLLSAIVYTLLGGFIAVAWCDLFQGLFLLVMIVLVPLYAFMQGHTFAAISDAAALKHVPLSLVPSSKDVSSVIMLALGWGLGYFGQPHILTNFMGIDDVHKIRYAKYVGITWQIIVLTASASIGLVSLSYFDTGIANPEMLFITMTNQLFIPILAGFILCGILAATLSTMDSHILVSGSVLAEDVYKASFNKKASSSQILWFSRIAATVVSLLALSIAWTNTSTIYNLVNYAWSGLGSAFGPLVITSLYGKNITGQGAIAGILAGACVSGLWPYDLPLVPGFFASLLAICTISFLTAETDAVTSETSS